MMRTFLLTTILLTVAALAWSQQPLDYAYFVNRLVDLDALPGLEPGTSCKQASSYDRRSHDPRYWDANGDAGQYETYDPKKHGPPLREGEALMAHINGPGCIFRIWSANPMGRIRFYLDGDTEPTYEFDFDGLFRGDYEDFQPPFVYKRGGQQSASNCYLPIPFARSIRVTADRPHGQYYHIGYMTYPRGTRVESFAWPLNEDARGAAAEVAEKWANCGADPRPPSDSGQAIAKSLQLLPHVPVVVAELDGPGVITTLKAKLSGEERYVWRKVLLEVWFDDERKPSIICPLGEFFGTGWQANDYRSFPMGVIDGEGYSYWAMPFFKRARVRLTHRGVLPAEVDLALRWEQATWLPADTALFHAKWRRAAPNRVFDYPLLETSGYGRLVGIALHIDHPTPGWWGEGDEKVWVDGEDFPSTFGTGSEEYFGDAWGIRDLHQPAFGCNLRRGTRTSCYRWHISDHIPYYKSLKMTIEDYPPFAEDYTSVAYWYQAPGGSDFFASYTADHWRPWGRSLAYAIEAEDVWADQLNGVIKPLADDTLPHEFNHGIALDFGYRNRNDRTPEGTFEVEQRDVYYPTAHVVVTERGREPALFELVIDDVTVAPVDDRRAEGLVVFEGVEMAAGPHRIALRYTEDGPLGLDCIQLEPSPKVANAIEAERLTPVRLERGRLAEDPPRARWSSGRQLLFIGDGEGAGMTLDLPGTEPGEANLVLNLTTGPDYADVRFLWLGEPVGQVVSCYSPRPVVRRVHLGTVSLPAQNRLLSLEVAGKHADATGHKIGVDYILLSKVLYPGAVEAEAAPVLRAHGGGVGIQENPGMAALSGHAHLFFTNHDPEGFVELEFRVFRDGVYDASAWFSHSWDYAVVQVLINGVEVGEPVDLYAPSWVHGGEAKLGSVELTEGKHTIRFQSVGRNEQSKGYYMGIDCFRLQRR